MSASGAAAAAPSPNAELLPHLLLRGAGGGGGGGAEQIKHVLLYDVTTRILPGALRATGAFVSRILRRRAARVCDEVKRRAAVGPRVKTGAIVLERDYKRAGGESSDMFDAVLAFASDLPQARYVRRTPRGVFTVETKDAIEIAPDVLFAKLNTHESEGEMEKMTIEVFSFSKDIVELRDYLNDLEQAYRKNRGNQLGRQLYYFDEILMVPPMRLNMSADASRPLRQCPDLSKANPNLHFTMFALHTNKSLNNIYGASMRSARRRVDFFLQNPDWYKARGIPYTLGVLLHGAPGCGKTSFIKGLARDTGRHVVNIKLGEYTTVQQINALFYTPRLHVVRDGASASYDIPMDRRIIVMEDIDCLSGVVLDRGVAEQQAKKADGNDDSNQLNLSVLLNILDGVLETPGRIVVMTSNAPWTLDRALVRPGRIDVSIEFTKCTPDDVLDMVQGICDNFQVDRDAWRPRLADKAWTPAEVTKAIFENMDDPENALEMFCAASTPPAPPLAAPPPDPTPPPPSAPPPPPSAVEQQVEDKSGDLARIVTLPRLPDDAHQLLPIEQLNASLYGGQPVQEKQPDQEKQPVQEKQPDNKVVPRSWRSSHLAADQSAMARQLELPPLLNTAADEQADKYNTFAAAMRTHQREMARQLELSPLLNTEQAEPPAAAAAAAADDPYTSFGQQAILMRTLAEKPAVAKLTVTASSGFVDGFSPVFASTCDWDAPIDHDIPHSAVC